MNEQEITFEESTLLGFFFVVVFFSKKEEVKMLFFSRSFSIIRVVKFSFFLRKVSREEVIGSSNLIC